VRNTLVWRIFKHVILTCDNSKVYISFGGLLLCLDGPYKKLSPLRKDNVYLLLKK
jgi:hypothetical protein